MAISIVDSIHMKNKEVNQVVSLEILTQKDCWRISRNLWIFMVRLELLLMQKKQQRYWISMSNRKLIKGISLESYNKQLNSAKDPISLNPKWVSQLSIVITHSCMRDKWLNLSRQVKRMKPLIFHIKVKINLITWCWTNTREI